MAEAEGSKNGKGQVGERPGLVKAIPNERGYFEYPVVELVVVDIGASFFCAQAPRLKALAKTVTIMIAFKNFNVYRPLSQLVAAVL